MSNIVKSFRRCFISVSTSLYLLSLQVKNAGYPIHIIIIYLIFTFEHSNFLKKEYLSILSVLLFLRLHTLLPFFLLLYQQIFNKHLLGMNFSTKSKTAG